MVKYFAGWSTGYGWSTQEIEADSQDEAELAAYELWLEEANSNAEYLAQKAPEGADAAEVDGISMIFYDENGNRIEVAANGDDNG